MKSMKRNRFTVDYNYQNILGRHKICRCSESGGNKRHARCKRSHLMPTDTLSFWVFDVAFQTETSAALEPRKAEFNSLDHTTQP
jgi:hypothetical protein